MSHGRKRNPFENEDGVWIDWWSPISDSGDGFEDDAIARMDAERMVSGLTRPQRDAVEKWMRDEILTNAERVYLGRALEVLRNGLK